MSLFRYTFSTLLLLFCFTVLKAQKLDPDKNYEVTCVGFYNLENLFYTIVDPDTNKIQKALRGRVEIEKGRRRFSRR